MRLALLLALAIGLASGCGFDDEGDADLSLEGVPWLLVAGVDVEGWETVAPSATFADGRLSGSAGCNRYGGPYTVDGGTLELGDIARTQRACPSPAGDVETAFLAALGSVAGWRMDDDELALLDADGEELLRFAAATPVGSWSATGFFRVHSFQTVVPGTKITLTLGDDGEVSGFAGCNSYTATYVTDAATIKISAPAATRLSCSERPGGWGVNEQDRAYLEALPTATQYRLDGGALQLLRADGTGLASFARAP